MRYSPLCAATQAGFGELPKKRVGRRPARADLWTAWRLKEPYLSGQRLAEFLLGFQISGIVGRGHRQPVLSSAPLKLAADTAKCSCRDFHSVQFARPATLAERVRSPSVRRRRPIQHCQTLLRICHSVAQAAVSIPRPHGLGHAPAIPTLRSGSTSYPCSLRAGVFIERTFSRIV